MTLDILVVDDEPDIVDLFRQRFRHEVRNGEYTLRFAHSADETLRQLDAAGSVAPGLLLLDINMPGTNGLDLLPQIKRRLPDLPIVMVTAYGDSERRRLGSERGAARYLVKPIDFTALKALISEVLED